VQIDAGVIVVRVVIGQVGAGEARVDPPEVLSPSTERRSASPHRGGVTGRPAIPQRLHENGVNGTQ